MATASRIKTYTTNLKKSKDSFNSLVTRSISSLDTLVKYNAQTRRLLFAQGLEFDLDLVVMSDLHSGSLTVQFSHALLVVPFYIPTR